MAELATAAAEPRRLARLVRSPSAAVTVAFFGNGALFASWTAHIPHVKGYLRRVPGVNAGTAVALVSACGWIGLVCGPVLIGQLAELTSLRLALVLVPALTALIAASTAACRALRFPAEGEWPVSG